MSEAYYVPRILIVEQTINVQASIALSLQQMGYVTATTRHREEAITIMLEDPYDVVVMDPFEGHALLELLQDLRSDDRLGFPRIILVTESIGRAMDAVDNGWADMALDKDTMDFEQVASAVASLLGV